MMQEDNTAARDARRERREQRFTPGPWHVTERPANDAWFAGRTIAARCDDGTPYRVADAFNLNPEFEANAALIAAAPEMYEALKAVLAYRTGTGQFNFSHLSLDQREIAVFDAWQLVEAQLRAALSKAAAVQNDISATDREPQP